MPCSVAIQPQTRVFTASIEKIKLMQIIIDEFVVRMSVSWSYFTVKLKFRIYTCILTDSRGHKGCSLM